MWSRLLIAAVGVWLVASVARSGPKPPEIKLDYEMVDGVAYAQAEARKIWEPMSGSKPVSVVEMDGRDGAQVRAGVATAQEALGHVDIVVNNAGINRHPTGLETTETDWDDHLDTNAKGGFFVAQAAAPAMIERGNGAVVVGLRLKAPSWDKYYGAVSSGFALPHNAASLALLDD